METCTYNVKKITITRSPKIERLFFTIVLKLSEKALE